MRIPPLMPYFGAKFSLADWIISFFPDHDTYVELFGGSAAILFAKSRSRGEVYNDINSEIVNLFGVLREQPERLRQLCYLTPYSSEEAKKCYSLTGEPVEDARRFLFRCNASFRGVGIFQWKGLDFGSGKGSGKKSVSLNVSAATEWEDFCNSIPSFAERLRGVIIEHRDAVELVKRIDNKGVLFYADPPYLFSTREDSVGIYANEYPEEEHRKLAAALHNIQGVAVVSGYDSPLYTELYADWRIEKRLRTGTVGSKTAGVIENHKRVECIWLSDTISGVQTRIF